MKVYAIRIFVDDWSKACDFYEHTLGLPLEFKDESFGWAEFDVGGPKFGIERVDQNSSLEDQALVGRFLGVSLQVEDAEEIYKELSAKGVKFSMLPEKQDCGGVIAHLKDPCENIITLMSENR